MAWTLISQKMPPKDADVVFGWWCYWRTSISWETDLDWANNATHWCLLPKSPPPDQSKIPATARVS